MTVEQNAIRNQQLIKNQETALNQLKEITGVQDLAALRHAYEASNGDITQAITFLTEGHEATTAAAGAGAAGAAGAAQGNPRHHAAHQPVAVATAATAAAQPANAPASVHGPRNRPQGEDGKSGDVIDLTQDRDEKEDLQRAIALSLQETTQASIGVSAEEQDISRVLEQSIRDAGQGRSNTWFVDPLNPHDRQRESGWPVGLKNVGNTCWFSAVIQSLFHLPAFRQLVLNFSPPPAKGTGTGDAKNHVHRNLLFMSELRSLFALMLGTRRKYVDPSKSVQILKAAFSGGGADNQQDVSEFTHKLLEWLEDAFILDTSGHPSQEEGADGGSNVAKNPMLDLFYGQYKAEGINEGKVFSNLETFGQCPLQINGYHDLHQSLEASMSKAEIETVNGDATYLSAQEHWFTRLPHVLIFELSRFQFNQELGRPEKIHNQFKFPATLYMDRYMDANREIVRKKREEVAVLRQQYSELQSRLERFLCYGSGAKRMPLHDVLQYTLEYANSGCPERRHLDGMGSPPQGICNNTSACEDVEMASPCGSASNSPRPGSSPNLQPMEQPFAPPSPTSLSLSTSPTVSSKLPRYQKPPPLNLLDKPPLGHGAGGGTAGHGGAGGSGGLGAGVGPAIKGELPSPKPGHITDTELNILQGCLKRWRTEVMSEVTELHQEIAKVDEKIHTTYEEVELKYHKYRLHAVLVHEGQALAGHYWSYILNHKRNVWIKFNDIAVTEVTFEELERVSLGGDGNASAYCVMYVESGNRALFEEVHAETGLINLEDLGNDLGQLIVDDNQKFEEELKQWDEQVQQRRQQQLQLQLKQGERGQADGGARERVTSRGASTTNEEVIAVDDVPMKDEEEAMSPRRVPPLANQDSMETSHPETRPKTPKSPRTPKSPVSAAPFFGEGGPEAAVQQMYAHELKKCQEVAVAEDPPGTDSRLESFAIYLLRNNAANGLMQQSILIQLKEMGLASDDLRSQAIGKIAQRKLESDQAYRNVHSLLKAWQSDYSTFIRTASFFNQGILLCLQQGLYQEALPYFVHACKLNETFDPPDTSKRMDSKLLEYFRRHCLIQLNEQCATTFDAGEEQEASTSLQVMSELVVPCTSLLGSNPGDDAQAVEEIRGRWCSYLGHDLPGKLQDKLQDLLSRLLDGSSDGLTVKTPPLIRAQRTVNHSQQFRKSMQLIKSFEEAGQGEDSS
ncbi:ubiquitin carboxyl-terminal hydrolase 25 isoform X2 [Strongylocentrotus purpuratus]|uniref:ubiquitinyl hydrolase 1 n=1 Tax=Strongylocentrotus purpuratus TaxID=7668 RepID=A0A7M7NCU0_STRPU|nr:ubiquitin carboxyl-terminal hydrolase 25 isoform X2 [Strongylocentrotus purpuratus]